MEKKLLVTDLDGTLLLDNNIICEEDVNKLIKFKHDGNYISVATGRSRDEVMFLFDDYGLEFDMIATLNGSEIIDHKGRVFSKRYIEVEKAMCILEDELIKNEDLIFVTEKEHFRNIKDFLGKGKKSEILTMNICFGDKDYTDIDKILEDLIKKYGHAVSIFRNKNYIDISPLGCSKGEALKEFRRRLDVNHKNTYSIGDSWNDLSMIKEANVGATFDSAEEKLKVQADKIVKNFSEFLEFVINI